LTNAAGCVIMPNMPFGRYTYIEDIDRERVLNGQMLDRNFRGLADSIAEHLLDIETPNYVLAVNARMQLAADWLERDLAIAVMILVESGLVNRKLAGSPPGQVPIAGTNQVGYANTQVMLPRMRRQKTGR